MSASAPVGTLYVLPGVFRPLPWRAQLWRIACAGLFDAAGACALFEVAIFTPAFDMRPATQLPGRATTDGHAIGNLGFYNSRFQFAARPTRPVVRLYPGRSLQDWARDHPQRLVVAYPNHLTPDDLRNARLVQPYRGTWMTIWNASTFASLRRGQAPPKPTVPTRLLPAPNYWRYADVR